jgi:L-asparaginase/Glu-tRNA(Gln) amidotransferase subunit D
LGSINGENLIYYYDTRKHIKLENKTAGKVALVKIHYDIEPDVVEYCFDKSDIVTIECCGGGRVPPKLLPIIDRNPDKFIVLTTRVATGHLYDEYSYEGSYQYLRERRVIVSPLNSLKSCLLAKLCLGNGKDYARTKEIFENFFG